MTTSVFKNLLLGHGFLILCLSKPPLEPMHCRSKNKKKTSIFIFLPTADSILCNSATNSTTEMADHFSFSTHSIDNKIVTYKLLSQFNPFLYCRQRNTIHLIIEFCDFFFWPTNYSLMPAWKIKKIMVFHNFFIDPTDRPLETASKNFR